MVVLVLEQGPDDRGSSRHSDGRQARGAGCDTQGLLREDVLMVGDMPVDPIASRPLETRGSTVWSGDEERSGIAEQIAK